MSNCDTGHSSKTVNTCLSQYTCRDRPTLCCLFALFLFLPTPQAAVTENMAPPLAAFAQGTTASPSAYMKCRTAAKEGEGDVMLVFKGDELPHLMVNAKVLSNASPVFRAMLATNYSDECLRSAFDPQILEGVECEQCDMWLLCLLLHGHDLNWPAGVDDYDLLVMLASMSVLAVKFDAVEYMKKAISSRLLKRFTKRVALPAKDEERACSRDALLAMIAHKLDQEDTFCLFSRRMILDHSFRLSDLDPNIVNQFPPLTLRKFKSPSTPELRLTLSQCDLRNSVSQPKRS